MSAESPLRECLSLGEYIILIKEAVASGDLDEAWQLLDDIYYGIWVVDVDG